MSDLVGVVTVNVREKNGFYVASSKELLGLYIADTDKERVLADVPNVIRALLKEKREVSMSRLCRELSLLQKSRQEMIFQTHPAPGLGLRFRKLIGRNGYPPDDGNGVDVSGEI